MQLKFLPWKYIQSSLPRPNTYLFVHSHITYHNQGICIKNRVRNGRKIFEIPALLSIPNPNEELQSGKFKKVYIVSTMNFDFFFSNFQRSGFPHFQDKKAGISNFFFCCSIPYFLYHPDHNHKITLLPYNRLIGSWYIRDIIIVLHTNTTK